ncbi:MAG: hypothetical protein GX456_11000 [Verrucomicrobia bacterium]|nr:hypothetical protein [Verrucomicrobiota bacterium]
MTKRFGQWSVVTGGFCALVVLSLVTMLAFRLAEYLRYQGRLDWREHLRRLDFAFVCGGYGRLGDWFVPSGCLRGATADLGSSGSVWVCSPWLD